MQTLAHVSLVVDDYDRAIDFYVGTLGFLLVEDTFQPEQNKRWVVVSPGGNSQTGGASIVLGKASNDQQATRIGNQTGGRVFLFLQTDDFDRDYRQYQERGVKFVRSPQKMSYGTVAVFEDIYGNLWDLIEYSD